MRIKTDVDLRKLKEFGFEYVPATQGYYKVYFPKLFKFIPLPRHEKVRGLAIYGDREIIIKKRYGFAWIPAFEDAFAIQDLINAGLVEA